MPRLLKLRPVARALRGLGLLVALGLFGGACGDAADERVVARIGAERVTEAELDAWIQRKLFARETEGRLHEVRMREIENLIEERLLAREAAGRAVTVPELIDAEVTSRAEVVREDELRAFYQQNHEHMRGASFEQMRARIRAFLEQSALGEARTAFIEKLRARESVQVLLEAARVAVSDVGPARGPEDAPVTLVEFSDYQCPFCQRAEATVAALLEAYPDELRFVYRHFPLESIHPLAHTAARAAHCADEQGQFWAYHERLFAPGADFERAGLAQHARATGLRLGEFNACLDAPRSKARVDEDLREGERLGVTSTPTFFINGVRVEGAQSPAVFRDIIERELRRAPRSADAS